MICNVGKNDRIVRSIIGIISIAGGYVSQNYALIFLGVSLLFTAFSGWCLMYSILGFDTGCSRKEE